MSQRRALSAAEAAANLIVGSAVSVVLTMALFGVGLAQSAGVVALFSVTSFLRAYALRRLFARLDAKRAGAGPAL